MKAGELVESYFERVYNQNDFAYVMQIFAEDYYGYRETGAQ